MLSYIVDIGLIVICFLEEKQAKAIAHIDAALLYSSLSLYQAQQLAGRLA